MGGGGGGWVRVGVGVGVGGGGWVGVGGGGWGRGLDHMVVGQNGDPFFKILLGHVIGLNPKP